MTLWASIMNVLSLKSIETSWQKPTLLCAMSLIYLIVSRWSHMAAIIVVRIGNGVLFDGTETLPSTLIFFLIRDWTSFSDISKCKTSDILFWPQGLLTHWGRVTHTCVGKLIILGSDNGLAPTRSRKLYSSRKVIARPPYHIQRIVRRPHRCRKFDVRWPVVRYIK